ncbi:MAG: sodium:calcium antiporter [Chloroflexi bacterium]|nr:sodium:calcium antiporter [Chloroflexota bacterium]
MLSWLMVAGGMLAVLGAAELFTNSVEWMGKHLKLGEAAVGSLLAAVGTAMPETILPIVAILLVRQEASTEIGIGAILGAPFMLSTAAFLVTGVAVFVQSARGRRTLEMSTKTPILHRDLRYFLAIYPLAVLSSFIPSHEIKLLVAVGLVTLYVAYSAQTLKDTSTSEGELQPLHISRNNHEPNLGLVSLQFLLSVAILVGGAWVFVHGLEEVALALRLSPLVLALILAPLATELPEKFNSVIWVGKGKDTLAMGNISGAMVFQSSIPVAVGLILTPWVLTGPALASAVIAVASTTTVMVLTHLQGRLTPHMLVLGGAFYLLFIGYLLFLLPRG